MASKVTSKLQVTIPKALAKRYDIAPGQEIEWLQAGEAIRVVPQSASQRTADRGEQLGLFDRATARQRAREREQPAGTPGTGDRGWTREDLYERGHAD